VNGDNQYESDKSREDLRDQMHRDIHDRFRQKMEDRMRRRAARAGLGPRAGGMLPGLVLVLIGTVVLLQHMGILPHRIIWTFWPAVLILFGVVKLSEPQGRVFGVVLLIVGAIFMLHNLGLTRLSWGDLWPIALIGAGLVLIWSRFEAHHLPPASSGSSTTNTINEFAMFGGVERRISVNNFAGGTVSATFGGVELDFRSADIEGEQAVVYVEAIFGGVEVTVPDRWTVIYEGQTILGGYSDETRPPLPDVPGAPPRKKLILRGRCVFGGISVKN
jgi:predicted membrane protein